jgi:putative addiction module component (TIGR02574 family)
MSHSMTDVSQYAKELPPEDRARLAEELLASLEDLPESSEDAAWDAELLRRVTEVENGTAKLLPADEVFARVRSSLR